MDTLTPPVFLNTRTAGMFNNKTAYPHFLSQQRYVNDPVSRLPCWPDRQPDQVCTYTRLGTESTFLWYFNPNGHLFARMAVT